MYHVRSVRDRARGGSPCNIFTPALTQLKINSGNPLEVVNNLPVMKYMVYITLHDRHLADALIQSDVH